MKYQLPTNNDQLNTLINTAIRSAGKTRGAIQAAAVGILYHAYKHGDYTGAGRLVQGLADKGVRRDSLVLYFQGFGGLVVNTDKETKGDQPFSGWAGKEHIEANFEAAKETMWDTVAKEKDPFVTMDLQTALMIVLKRFEKVAKDSQGEGFQGKISYALTGDVMDRIRALSQRQGVDTSDAAVIDKLDQLLAGNAEGEAAEPDDKVA